jgi:hypothetical protein
MALTNLEEAIVERIQRALAKELRRLRGASRSTGHGQATSQIPVSQTEAMARTRPLREPSGGKA